MIYRLLGFGTIIIQVAFIVHAIRNGRDRWVYIILFVPLVGSLAYFFAEYLPDLRSSARLNKSRSAFETSPKKAGFVERLEKIASHSPSYENKFNLAGAYLGTNKYDEAISIYQDIVDSPNANKIDVIEGLSEAYYRQNNFEKARDYLLSREELCNDQRPDDYSVLLGFIYEKLGNFGEALNKYKDIMHRGVGEQARFRYGLLQKKLGNFDTAKQIFKQVIENVDLSPRYYKKQQKKWYKLAKDELKTL